MIAYKLMRLKNNGAITSLFINKSREYHFNEWMDAEFIPTKGFAQRPGWHCTPTPHAPHLKQELASGEKRVWVRCDVTDWTTYDRPESQGGVWLLASKIKLLEVCHEI